MFNDFKDKLDECKKYGYRPREDSYSTRIVFQNLWITAIVGIATFILLYFIFIK